jgi:protein ImuB
MSQALIPIPAWEPSTASVSADVVGRQTPRPLWLAVYFPQLALSVYPETEAARPVVVIDRQGKASRVLAANAAAAGAGVEIGSGVLPALATCSGLKYRERSEARERQYLEELATWALQLTSVVSVIPYDALLLEVGGSIRLLGGLSAIKARVSDEFMGRGLAFHVSTAPTRLGSLWLARHGSGDAADEAALRKRLAALPLAVTRWPDKVLALLHELGIASLGECLRLPRDGLALRCGQRVLADLDKALGRIPDLVDRFVPTQVWSSDIDFIEGLSAASQLHAAVEQLASALGCELRRRQAQVRKVEILFRYAGARSTKHEIEMADPTHDAGRLRRLLICRIEKLDLSGSVLSMECRARLEFLSNETDGSLFDPRQKTGSMPVSELVELLRARLGRENVYGVAAVPDHRPEKAWRQEDIARADDRSMQFSAGRCARPLWLLAAPIALPGADRPQGEIAKLSLEPERIQTGWWDGNEVSRDYYVAKTVHGARWWIYRERDHGGWYLHGLFG